jgi:hypothetical protein
MGVHECGENDDRTSIAMGRGGERARVQAFVYGDDAAGIDRD